MFVLCCNHGNGYMKYVHVGGLHVADCKTIAYPPHCTTVASTLQTAKQSHTQSTLLFLPLTLSRQGGHFVPPHLYHSISSKRLGVWSYCFVKFILCILLSEKFSYTNQPSRMLSWQPCNFSAFENSNLVCFSSISA